VPGERGKPNVPIFLSQKFAGILYELVTLGEVFVAIGRGPAESSGSGPTLAENGFLRANSVMRCDGLRQENYQHNEEPDMPGHHFSERAFS
jgi:hypothetical protein